MKSPIKKLALLVISLIMTTALAGCGNKGPLVRPSDIPATAPAVAPAEAEPVATPVKDPAAAPAPEPASGTPAAGR